MTQLNKDWLKNSFPQYYKQQIIDNNKIEAYYKAEMLLNGWEHIQRRGCKCEYSNFIKQVNNSYDLWVETEKVST